MGVTTLYTACTEVVALYRLVGIPNTFGKKNTKFVEVGNSVRNKREERNKQLYVDTETWEMSLMGVHASAEYYVTPAKMCK